MCLIWPSGSLSCVMLTGWWGRSGCAMKRSFTICAAFACCLITSRWDWVSRLLLHACRGLADKPVVCQALPFEKPFYLKAGFADMPLNRLKGALFSLYEGQMKRGYLVELLVRDLTQPHLHYAV